MQPHSRWQPLIIALLLVLIGASRAFRLDATVTEVTVDEVWSVWQTLGTPQQILQWTPYDWTPGYYLTLGGWRALVGLNPIALRWLSLMAFLIGAAAIYRVARRLQGSGEIAMLAYAAFAFLIFLSTELRGYALLLGLFPLAIWLAVRWLDHPRLPRAILFALTMAAMISVSMTSFPALGALALFTLIVYRRRVWRWWLPGGLALLITLPEIASKFSMVSGRGEVLANMVLQPFPGAVVEMYRLWTSSAPLLWLVLIALALALLIRTKRRWIAAGLIVWALLPAALYLSNSLIGFFNVRYAWWVMPGIALLIGQGLARLPRVGRTTAAAAFAVVMLLPIPLNEMQIPQPPLATAFDWLRGQLRPGDVLLIDPNCGCGAPEVFEYYTRVYFPDGLQYVTSPDDQRRVWYVTGSAGATPAVRDVVEQGRIAERFVGPPEGLFRLYEAPPDPAGVTFDNGTIFHGGELPDVTGVPIFHEGDPLRLRLWWSAESPLPLDYSVGVFILDDAGEVIAQDDRAPAVIDAPSATSQWQPGQLYVEERTLQLPYPLTVGTYHVVLAVYWYGDQKRIPAPGVDDQTLLPVLDFDVMSWGH